MESEFMEELNLLRKDGLKTNLLRLEYEEKVRKLQSVRERLFQEEKPIEEIAKILHSKRRQLGKEYKDAAPPLFREYIFYATEQKYGDPLGPSYEVLRKDKTPEQIIASSVRPIQNLDHRLTVDGFVEWFYQTYQKT